MKCPVWPIAMTAALALPLSACLINENKVADAPLSTLAQGAHSGVDSQRFEVIRDAVTLNALWREHTAEMDPPPALPQVDFEQTMVIAAFLGQRRTGGYAVQINALRGEDDTLTAQVTVTQPGTNCFVTQAINKPYHLVTTPLQEHVINFQVSRVNLDCK